MVRRMNNFKVVVMHLTPECSALIWLADPFSSVAVRGKMSLRSADRQIQIQLFLFSPLKDSCMAAVSVFLSASSPPSERQSNKPSATPAALR